ncbi:MAG: PAS domain S-box protein [Chloroflexi bacterium]|nr:PAS domain S-box protein [Chloroflexota bacterium]
MSPLDEATIWRAVAETIAELTSVTSLDGGLHAVLRTVIGLTRADAVTLCLGPDVFPHLQPDRRNFVILPSGDCHWQSGGKDMAEGALAASAEERWLSELSGPYGSVPDQMTQPPGPWSALILPILSESVLVGTLRIHHGRGHTVAQGLLPALRVLAGLTATALTHDIYAERTRQHMRRLQAVERLGNALREAIELEDILIVGLRVALSLVCADWGQIVLTDATTHSPRQRFSLDSPGNSTSGSYSWRPLDATDQQLFTAATLIGEQIVLDATGQPVRQAPPGSDVPRQQRVLTPIVHARAIVGILDVSWEAPTAPSAEDRTTLEILASPLGSALARAQILKSEREARHELMQALRSSGSVLFSYSLDGAVRHVEGDLQSLLGYQPSEAIGRPLTDFVHPSALVDVVDQIRKRQAGDVRPLQYETTLLHRTGHPVPALIATGSLSAADRNTIVGIVTNLATTKQLQRERDEALTALQAAAAATLTVILTYDCDGAILRAQGACQELLGYGPEELTGQSLLNLTHPHDRSFTRAHLNERTQGSRKLVQIDTRYRHRDGHYVDVLASAGPRIVNDQVVGGAVTVTSMVSLKLAQRQRDEALQMLQMALTRTHAVTLSFSLEGIIDSAQGACEELLGYHPHDILGHNILEFITPEDEAQMRARLSLFRSGGSQEFQDRQRLRHASGSSFTALMSCGPHYVDGELTGRIALIVDITATQTLENERDEAWRTLEFALRSTSTALLIYDARGTIKQVHGATAALLGWEPEELVNQSIVTLLDPSVQAFVSANLEEHLGYPQSNEIVQHPLLLQHRDDHPVDVLATFGPYHVLGELPGRAIIITDITGLRTLERQHSETLQRLKLALTATSTALISYDLNGTILSADGAIEELTGASPESLLGKPIAQLVAETDVARVTRALAMLASGEYFPRQLEFSVKGTAGSMRDILVTIAQTRNGSLVTGGVSIITDVSAQKHLQAERDHLTAANARAEGAIRTGRSVMHQLASPLATILGRTALILQRYQLPEEVRTQLR